MTEMERSEQCCMCFPKLCLPITKNVLTVKCFKIGCNIIYVTSYSYGGGQLLFKFCRKKTI
jgi:hypothetical protein